MSFPANSKSKAELLRRLHFDSKILILPNAFDAASARVFEVAGFEAVGTSSAGIAFALGYPDGQHIPRSEMVFIIQRIAQTVNIPVTADIEAGFLADSETDPLETILRVLEAGAVGINFEDSIPGSSNLIDIETQSRRILAIREYGNRVGIPIVINARTDAFQVPGLSSREQISCVVERAGRYKEAGADCVFVPFVSDPKTIQQLVKQIDSPVNILATAGTPSISELQDMGVARVSVGGGPSRACYGLVRDIAHELKDCGTYSSFGASAISYPEMNRMLTKNDQK